MGKTPASTRAGRKAKSKNPERKWCTCQERCNGGKEVAASTYRSHNPATRPTTVQDGSKSDPVAVAGGKRKARLDADELDLGNGPRETRRMRARRIAQDGEPASPPAAEGPTDTLGLDGVRPQESKTREHRDAQVQDYVESYEEEEEPSWIPSVEVYPINHGNENYDDYEEDDQIRITLRSVNKMVSAILSWD